MRFSDFVQLMHRYIGCSVTQQEYVLYLTNLVIRDPMTDDEEKLEENDDFNPLSSKDVSTLSKIYSGTQNRKIKQDHVLFRVYLVKVNLLMLSKQWTMKPEKN